MTPTVLIPGYMLDDALWCGMLPFLPPELPLHFASLAEGDSIIAMAQAVPAFSHQGLGFCAGALQTYEAYNCHSRRQRQHDSKSQPKTSAKFSYFIPLELQQPGCCLFMMGTLNQLDSAKQFVAI